MKEKKPAQWRRLHEDIVYSAALNHVIKGRSEAVVLHHIADMIHDGRAVCYPTQAHLVEATGLPRATLNRALDHLVANEVIGRHTGTGGRHSVYWLPLPAKVADSLSYDIAAIYQEHIAAAQAHLSKEGYVSSMGQSVSHTWDSQCPTHGTLSVPSGETHIETSENKPSNKPENETVKPAGAGIHREFEGKKEQPPVLRPASMKERALWHGAWPNETDLVSTNLDAAYDAKASLTKEMLWVLGYRAGADVEGVQARGERRVEVQQALDDSTVHVMRMMSAARKLRKADLADWLAINGFAPINAGDTNAQAA